jgi:hypothetical protein
MVTDWSSLRTDLDGSLDRLERIWPDGGRRLLVDHPIE